MDGFKDATEATRAPRRRFLKALPVDDGADFDDAATASSPLSGRQDHRPDGRTVWDMDPTPSSRASGPTPSIPASGARRG